MNVSATKEPFVELVLFDHHCHVARETRNANNDTATSLAFTLSDRQLISTLGICTRTRGEEKGREGKKRIFFSIFLLSGRNECDHGLKDSDSSLTSCRSFIIIKQIEMQKEISHSSKFVSVNRDARLRRRGIRSDTLRNQRWRAVRDLR
jgi:hypothetical protein